MIILWLRGFVRRPWRAAGEAAGIAIAVAMMACLGTFLAHSQATMTDRAVRAVGVDWQVQLRSGADLNTVTDTLRADPAVTGTAAVTFGASPGLTAHTGGTTQSTGDAVILGIPADYRSLFPAEIRPLVGDGSGVLLSQQAAANLHAAPGDTVLVGRPNLADRAVLVDGIIDLPLADSLFQQIGPAGGAAAPPDNVLVLPQDLWHQVFDEVAAGDPTAVTTQIHTRLDHALPADPATAFTTVTAAAHHVEATTTGAAVIGDNLATTLGAARSDAAYAQVLFLFLGLPGAALAALVTRDVAAAGADRRRREHALLRARGAATAHLMRLAAAETVLIGLVGVLGGLVLTAVVGRLAVGSADFGATPAAGIRWAVIAAAGGMGIALLTILTPIRRDLRTTTVAAGRTPVPPLRSPTWARYGLDAVALLAAGLIVAATGRDANQLVLAPEGAPGIAVSYWPFAGPALLWIGAGLLTWRCTDLLLGRGHRLVRHAVRPLAGPLAQPVAAGLSRQRRPLTRAITLLALAVAFAASTSTFNATYTQQAEIDAQLTNGADVTVTPPPGTTLPAATVAGIAATDGVRSVEPIQHRYAYIGSDVQDLYGVRPDTIRSATALQDTYFTGGTADTLLATMSAQPDAILVSAETVTDYQLQVGDPIKLRLVDSRSHQLTTVPFRYIGVVNEFPTAPRDSFFVANADYVADRTSSDATGAYLVDTAGAHSPAVAAAIQSLVGTDAIVTDITTTRTVVGSSLTAVDLGGLTRVELAFALALAVAAAGLVFGLGLADRRRTFAIATALGAGRRDLRGLISSEAALLGVIGLAAGALVGAAVSRTLIAVLSGVFDPPPAVIAVPWPYLVAVAAVVVAALTAVGAVAVRAARRDPLGVLRDL